MGFGKSLWIFFVVALIACHSYVSVAPGATHIAFIPRYNGILPSEHYGGYSDFLRENHVCVHGEPERLDNIQYFLEQLQGVASTRNVWVQSDGSKCIKPAIIYGDVSRPKLMTVRWAESAQSMTNHRVKGILTGPVTILNSSFLRNDLTQCEICLQISMAIKKEVLDLEAAGINIIQIDEPGIHEALPLCVVDRVEYLNWVAECFRITNYEVKDTTQIHTHLSHSNIDDIVNLIIKMDPDVVTFHNSRVDELVSLLSQNVQSYDGGIGLAIYDIHSLDVPSANAMADTVRKMSAQLNRQKIWINTECGLKTCAQETVKDVLSRMVEAAGHLRSELPAATSIMDTSKGEATFSSFP